MNREIKIVVIIPARGGSKRLPNKNIKQLNGKPLISYSIEYAQKNIPNADIIVSTDNVEISAISKQFGAIVQKRPSALSEDETPTIDVLQYVIKQVDNQYDFIVLLQPTNPLRPDNLFHNAWNALLDTNEESLFTVSLNHHKLGKINNGVFMPTSYNFGERSQDLSPLYYENGLIYISSTSLIKKGILMNESSVPMIVNHTYSSVDIDTELDWNWAEFLIQQNL